jgi:hypothetical protein
MNEIRVLGRQIRELRKAKRVTLKDLAAQIAHCWSKTAIGPG